MLEETYIGYINTGYPRAVRARELKAMICDGDAPYTPRQYCDWRFSTNLERFMYDPWTGHRIEWRDVRSYLEK